MTVHKLYKPLITEKAMAREQVYVFEVNPGITKQQIAAAIEETYGVTVGSVRTLVTRGRVKSVGKKRIAKLLPARKKAYVTLTKGEISDMKVK